jgi:flagellar L-ring protein precursor FlgH
MTAMIRDIESCGRRGLYICQLLVLSGVMGACSVTPSSIVQSPTTARPVAADSTSAANGAIYRANAYKPLFEDRRARFVGDILTIQITENTSARKQGAGSSSKTGKVDASIDPTTGLPINLKKAISVGADSSLSNEEKSAASSSNNFSGTISVTVVDVLENGNLVVSGEKQVAFDRGTEFVRFSGVVNPDTIMLGNVVPSTKVADARIEYRTNSQLDAAQVASILARFFLSFSPL